MNLDIQIEKTLQSICAKLYKKATENPSNSQNLANIATIYSCVVNAFNKSGHRLIHEIPEEIILRNYLYLPWKNINNNNSCYAPVTITKEALLDKLKYIDDLMDKIDKIETLVDEIRKNMSSD